MENENLTASSAANARSRVFKKLNVKNASELAYLVGAHQLIEMLDL